MRADMRIGIDFDNTIACYADVFAKVARNLGLLNSDFEGGKHEVKAAIIARPDGEKDWMRVQGQVYGSYMDKASVYPGFDNFISRARNTGGEIMIISHKTEFGHFDPARINLREAAMTWLVKQGISGHRDAPIPAERVFFEETRDEKIARIRNVGCTHYIDDLPEVLTHHEFPGGIGRCLFSETSQPATDGIYTFATWQAIEEHLFGPHG